MVLFFAIVDLKPHLFSRVPIHTRYSHMASSPPKVTQKQYQMQAKKLEQLEQDLQAALNQVCRLESEKAELRKANNSLSQGETKRSTLEQRYQAAVKEVELERKKAAAAEGERDRVRSDANSAISAWKDAVEQWQKDNALLQDTVASLQKIEASLKVEAHDLRIKLDGEKRKNQSLETLCGTLQVQSEQAMRGLESNKQALLAANDKNSDLARLNTQLQESNVELGAKVNRQEKHLAEVTLRLQTAEEEIADALITKQALERETRELRHQVDDAVRLGEQSAMEMRKQTARLEEMQLQLDDKEARCREITSKVAHDGKLFFDSQTQLQSLHKELIDMQHSRDAALAEKRALQRKLDDCEGELIAAKEGLRVKERVEDELSEHQLFVGELRGEVASLQGTIEARDVVVASLRESLANATAAAEELKKQLHDEHRSLTISIQDAEVLRRDLTLLNEEVARLKDAAASDKSKMDNLEAEREQLVEEASRLRQEQEAHLTDVAALQSQIVTLNSALSSSGEEHQALVAKFTSLQAASTDVQGQSDALRAELETRSTQLVESATRICCLQTEIEARDATISSQAAEHSEAIQRLSEQCSAAASAAAMLEQSLTALQEVLHTKETELAACIAAKAKAEKMISETKKRLSEEIEAKLKLSSTTTKTSDALLHKIQELQSSEAQLRETLRVHQTENEKLASDVKRHRMEADNAIEVKNQYKAEYNSIKANLAKVESCWTTDAATYNTSLAKANEEIEYWRNAYKDVLERYQQWKAARNSSRQRSESCTNMQHSASSVNSSGGSSERDTIDAMGLPTPPAACMHTTSSLRSATINTVNSACPTSGHGGLPPMLKRARSESIPSLPPFAS